MTELNRCAATATILVATSMVAACGDFTLGESSNRGSGSETSETTVENAFVVPRYLPGSCAIQVGDSAELRFTITNNRPVAAERLQSITTAAADTTSITPSPPIEVAAGKSFSTGQPVTPGRPLTVMLEGITDSVQPAKNIEVTFRFQEFGELTTLVPVNACPRQQ